MKEKVAAFIRENGLIPRGASVVAGVSGGADSVALVYVLMQLKEELGARIFAAHLNHGIRGADADADEAYVVKLCETLGVPLICERADIPALARAHSHTLEQEGRIERYAFLERARAHFDADLVAVAHHRDDQAESVLMHLMRGSGLAGLTGMRPKRGNLIRPLLCVRKSEIEAYLARKSVAYCTDATNLVPEGTRNRTRLEIIPYIEAHINPALTETLCSAAELLARDEAYLDAEARRALASLVKDGGYERAKLAELPLSIQTRAIRIALAEAGAAVDIERAHVEAVTSLLTAQTGAQIDLPGAVARASYDLVFFEKPQADAREDDALPLAVPGVTVTQDGEFRAEYTNDTSFTANPFAAYMDADKLPEALVVRRRRPGDRFFPLGAPGSRKLKEYFIDRKVPREARETPLIASGDTVLFIPGFGIADTVKITAQTTRALRVEYISSGLRRNI